MSVFRKSCLDNEATYDTLIMLYKKLNSLGENTTDHHVFKSGTDHHVFKSGTDHHVFKSGTDHHVFKSGTDHHVLTLSLP